jgi:NTE family protein
MPRGRSNVANDEPRKMDLVIEAGGVLGIAEVGALSVLEERGYTPENIAGTSAGAYVGALYAAGYRGEELHGQIADQRFEDFMDPTAIETIPLVGVVGEVISIAERLGLYKGDALERRLRELLSNHDVHTFKDLRHPDYANEEPRFRYRLQVIVSDLTARRLVVLPRDAQEVLGVDPDDLDVARAVRMSIAIPFFFTPVRFHNPTTKQDHLIVDGGVLSSFPVWLFDVPDRPRWPTFGIYLVPDSPQADRGSVLETHPLTGPFKLVEYVRDLVGTALDGHDRMYMDEATFVRTITIPTHSIAPHNFSLTTGEAETLYQAGRTAATQFLSTWSFEEYVAAYRSGRPPRHRRDRVVSTLRSHQKRRSSAPGEAGAPVA